MSDFCFANFLVRQIGWSVCKAAANAGNFNRRTFFARAYSINLVLNDNHNFDVNLIFQDFFEDEKGHIFPTDLISADR